MEILRIGCLCRYLTLKKIPLKRLYLFLFPWKNLVSLQRYHGAVAYPTVTTNLLELIYWETLLLLPSNLAQLRVNPASSKLIETPIMW